MRNLKYTTLLAICTLIVSSTFSQAYKTGDKAEALINNAWKEVTILKLVSGKTDVYDVRAVTATGKSTSVIATYQVKEENLRGYRKVDAATAVSATVATKEVSSPVVGEYKMYAGIQNIYMGHLVILDATNYKVALASDEDSFATGTYTFDAATNTITWKTGFCWQKKWEGKFDGKRIQLNRQTYADHN